VAGHVALDCWRMGPERAAGDFVEGRAAVSGRVESCLLLDGLAMPESPRWHNGRLWFSDWGAEEIVAVDLAGISEVVERGPEGAGWAVDWWPDGRMLITGGELVRVEPDGRRVRHADLSHLSAHGWSEMTVDGRGNVDVNSINFDVADFEAVLTRGRAPGKIALPVSGRAARSSIRSSSTVPASRQCSAVPTGERCSC